MKRSASQPTNQMRCAIYTRVSTDAGLEQEFNSLDNQREAGEAYIKSQAHEGWRLLPQLYDDGGYSGGSLDRPALTQLLADIGAGKIDIVVVYKVDRLTRSLADFARLVETFDAHKVSFVSVTQAFNTTNSMGRLTLNVLLSFAQFEREVTGERIRDKIAASKRKGLWMGGTVPYGYRVVDRKLLIDETEAVEVRAIFARYLELQSVPALVEDLRVRGFVTRTRQRKDGRTSGGIALTTGPLCSMLKNRTYLGEINHKGQAYSGEHQAIVDKDTFEAVGQALQANRNHKAEKWRASGALLLGKIFDDRGNRMTPSFAVKSGVRYRYYVSCAIAQRRKDEAGTVSRVSATEVEEAVKGALMGLKKDLKTLSTMGRENITGDAGIAARELVHAYLEKVVVEAKALVIYVKQANPTKFVGAADRDGRDHADGNEDELNQDIDVQTVAAQIYRDESNRSDGNNLQTWKESTSDGSRPLQRIVVPIHWQKKTRHRAVYQPEASTTGPQLIPPPIRSEARARLLIAIAKARLWVDQLLKGEKTTLSEIANAERVSERHIRMTLPLAFLAPDIVKGIAEGTLPHGVGISTFTDVPKAWSEQWQRIKLGGSQMKADAEII